MKLPKWFWISSLAGFSVPFSAMILIFLVHQMDIRRPDDRFSFEMLLFAASASFIIAIVVVACTYVGVKIKERGLWG